MEGSKNWMRKYILKAGLEGQKGFSIGNTTNAYTKALHISFSVEKSDSSSPNNTTIQIWNLNDDNIAILEQEGCVVELTAGYDEAMSLIFVGEVEDVITNMSGADRLTEVTVVDGMKSLSESQICLSLKGKVTSKKLYQVCASKMGLPILMQDGINFSDFPNGYSYVGEIKDLLDKVTEANDHKWSIQNEVLEITNVGEGLEETGLLLNEYSGLINVPKRIKIGVNDSKEKGWEVEFLLNGSVNINDIVRLESQRITGEFRVYKLTMAGDNMGGDWKCTAQLVDLDF